MICIGYHLGGHTLALQLVAKTTFCLYLVKPFNSYAQI